MRIAVATVGRFHMFALARELHLRGLLSQIFSGFPWAVLARELLPREKVSTFPVVRPIMMAFHKGFIRPNRSIDDYLHLASIQSLDWFVERNWAECDIFVGHEGIGPRCATLAQNSGSIFVFDRGCSHSLFRARILEEEFSLQGLRWHPPNARIVDFEVAQYDMARAIVVPSEFVKRSFLAEGIAESKIMKATYGVQLEEFWPDGSPDDECFQVLFCGSVSARKGIAYLLEAFRKIEVPKKRLIIVGEISPELADLPGKTTEANIVFAGVKGRSDVRRLMSKSHVLVLPSIEEGLALVQAEALACGCPVIATPNTGAEDIFTDGIEGFVVPIRDSDAIAEKLQLLYATPDLRRKLSCAAVCRVQKMGGWTSYAEAMVEIYRNVLGSASR